MLRTKLYTYYLQIELAGYGTYFESDSPSTFELVCGINTFF